DTDLSVLEEYRNVFLNCLPSLLEKGFEVGRYDGTLLSILKEGEYIDVYFFKKSVLRKRVNGGYSVSAKYLEKTVKFNFLGTEFQIPRDAENFLEDLYGEDWRIPKEGAPASNPGLYMSFTIFVHKRFPSAFRLACQLKKMMGLSRNAS
ncbi:MAG: hypothetical protein GXP16_14380, partial [Gammaproteobacteria bacterium]|nr:hypothetical protein [Gammaproteobacteria bacterium]